MDPTVRDLDLIEIPQASNIGWKTEKEISFFSIWPIVIYVEDTRFVLNFLSYLDFIIMVFYFRKILCESGCGGTHLNPSRQVSLLPNEK